MSKPLTFVLNDETKVNSYGFRTRNENLDLERFKENPVMLAQHENNLFAVIGRWLNIRIEGSKLLADAEFDEEDPDTKKIAGKVKRGFIKACSMGLLFMRENMVLAIDGIFDLIASELMEGSIVAVPSNANAVRLFAPTGELMADNEIKLCLTAVMANPHTKPTSKEMEKFILSAVALTALGLTVSPENSAELNLAVENLQGKLLKANADLDAEKTKVTELESKIEGQVKLTAETMVKQAVAEGKILATEEAEYIKDATANYELTAKLLSKIPAKQKLSTGLSNSNNATEVKTVEDFMKLSHEAQLSFKSENSSAYKSLFK